MVKETLNSLFIIQIISRQRPSVSKVVDKNQKFPYFGRMIVVIPIHCPSVLKILFVGITSRDGKIQNVFSQDFSRSLTWISLKCAFL